MYYTIPNTTLIAHHSRFALSGDTCAREKERISNEGEKWSASVVVFLRERPGGNLLLASEFLLWRDGRGCGSWTFCVYLRWYSAPNSWRRTQFSLVEEKVRLDCGIIDLVSSVCSRRRTCRTICSTNIWFCRKWAHAYLDRQTYSSIWHDVSNTLFY